MPIYEFECIDCNNIQEEFLSLREIQLEDLKISCHKCGSRKINRIVTRANGLVKGTQTPTRS